MTKFDVYLQAQAYVSASLGIFSQKASLLDKKKVWESEKWMLFSLPKITVSSSGSFKKGQTITFSADVQDGKNDKFDDKSIKWLFYPTTGVLESKGRGASFVPSEDYEYTVFFSGYGVLGEMGRQFIPLSKLRCTYGKVMTVDNNGNWVETDNRLETCWDSDSSVYSNMSQKEYYPSGNIKKEMLWYQLQKNKMTRAWQEDGKITSVVLFDIDGTSVSWSWCRESYCTQVAKSEAMRNYTDQQHKTVSCYDDILSSCLGGCACCQGGSGSGCILCYLDIFCCTTTCPIPEPTVSTEPLSPANKSLWTGWQ